MSLIRAIWLTMLVLLAASVWAQQSQQFDTTPRPSPFPVGEAMPNPVRYEFDDGGEIDLTKYKGQAVVIYHGADWCPPCFYARPTAVEMSKKYKQQGVTVIVLLSDPEKRREANNLAAQKGGYLMGMPKRELCKTADCKYGLKGGPWTKAAGSIPAAWVVDREGVVRAYLNNAQPICDELEPELKKVL
jgi:peroxiredoxin